MKALLFVDVCSLVVPSRLYLFDICVNLAVRLFSNIVHKEQFTKFGTEY